MPQDSPPSARPRWPLARLGAATLALFLPTTALAGGSDTGSAQLGLWAVQVTPADGLLVDRPDSVAPGASLRLQPGPEAPGGGALAVLDTHDRGFDGVRFLARVSGGPDVQARVRIDGELIALPATDGREEAFDVPQPGRRLQVEVEAMPGDGWEVLLHGIVLQRHGADLLFSPDAAGLEVRLDPPDRVRFGFDPDFAELGWPVAGHVTVALPAAATLHEVGLRIEDQLPGPGLLARIGVDGLPLALLPGGEAGPEPLTFAVAGGHRLELSLRIVTPTPAKTAWSWTASDLRLDGVAPWPDPEPPGGADASGAADVVGAAGTGPAPGPAAGCAARPRAAPAAWLPAGLVLLGLVLRWGARGRRRRSAATCGAGRDFRS